LKRGGVVRLEQPMQPPSLWVVTALEANRRVARESRRRGLRFVATHDLLPAASATMNTLTVQASGVLAVLLWPLLRAALRHALTAENRAFKRAAKHDAHVIAAAGAAMHRREVRTTRTIRQRLAANLDHVLGMS
jgi:hypothetical protein